MIFVKTLHGDVCVLTGDGSVGADDSVVTGVVPGDCNVVISDCNVVTGDCSVDTGDVCVGNGDSTPK